MVTLNKDNVSEIGIRVVLIEKAPFDVQYKHVNSSSIYSVKDCVELNELINGLKHITDYNELKQNYNIKEWYVVMNAKMVENNLGLNMLGRIILKGNFKKIKQLQ